MHNLLQESEVVRAKSYAISNSDSFKNPSLEFTLGLGRAVWDDEKERD